MASAGSTRYGAIVVGSGFGGAVSAARLSEAGLRVLVLERGPWWGTGRSDRPAADTRGYPRGVLGSRRFLRGVRYASRGRRFERVLNRDGFLELHRFERLTAITSSGVGGGSHHYTAIMREPSSDFFDAYPPEMARWAAHRAREGGCRMARSPAEGVTDHRGAVFGHPGLFVADGSVYPRSPGIAPSMTIAAVAERQAKLIAA